MSGNDAGTVREAIPWLWDDEKREGLIEFGRPTMRAWVTRVLRGDAPLSDEEIVRLSEKVLNGTPDEQEEARWLLFPYQGDAP